VPYQSFDSVVGFLSQAADDPSVKDVSVTLYRVARDSEVCSALIRAAERGKDVTAFVEVKARFDEQPNIDWGREMEAAGVKVVYSKPGIKVHAKVALVGRAEADGKSRDYAYLATGNFNEKTAHVYADLGLFTADQRIGKDVRKLFRLLTEDKEQKFKHLLVAPKGLRPGFEYLIDREIAHAADGLPARITAKMNSLEDGKMIEKLYEASRAGVKIRLVVRGICRLRPGLKGVSDGIEVTSIVDRFLEHTRIFRFENAGDPEYYLGSADWMRRNLNRRVEVVFPIYDQMVKAEIGELLEIQLRDNVKARIIDASQANSFVENGEPACRAQEETYRRKQRADVD
jgi:polyphosphate kinase